MESPPSFGTKVGTLSGTALAIAGNMWGYDVLRTIGLAALGAVTSFFVSLFLKWLVKVLRQ